MTKAEVLPGRVQLIERRVSRMTSKSPCNIAYTIRSRSTVPRNINQFAEVFISGDIKLRAFLHKFTKLLHVLQIARLL